MHVIHIIRDLDAASGGPSRSVPALAAAQSDLPGLRVSVVFGDRGNPLADLGTSTAEFLPVESDIGSQINVASDVPGPTVLHLHGLWDPLMHKAARFAQGQEMPYTVSTRGMLADWALSHKALKKKIGWWLYQRRDLKQSQCLLASSQFEEESIRRLLPGHRIEVIPNGCHERPEITTAEIELPQNSAKRWALALGRLHPVKGYAELIDAWARVKPEGWSLAIAGPDEDGYRSVIEQRIRSLGLEGQVILPGEVGDIEKWSLLDQCELFIAPSHTENFGMAIAEALQSGKPVLTTTGTPWQELQDFECGWWVAPEVQAISHGLRQATEMPPEVLRQMGDRGRQLIQEKYSWAVIAERTVDVYRSIMTS